jgi:hypothetical protein
MLQVAAVAGRIAQMKFVHASYKLPSYYGQNSYTKLKNKYPLIFFIFFYCEELEKSLYIFSKVVSE